MLREDDGAPARIHINPPLPCGIAGCGQPATEALAEPAPDDPALWQLMPVCDACMGRLQQEARSVAMHARDMR